MKRTDFFAARVAAFFAACALAWGSAFCDATAAEPIPTTTIQAGADFDVPLLVAGKPAIGRAHLAADNVLRIYWVADGRIAGPLLYTLTRQGDVEPPIPPKPEPKPPTPVKRTTDIYVVWETSTATPAEAAIRNNQSWKDESTKLKIRWGQMDIDTIANVPKFAAVAAAAKGKLPCVVLVDEAGGTRVEPLPKTPAAMLDLVRRAGK